MELFEKVEAFIDREFEEAGRPDHLTHLERTVHWVKQLEDGPSEALLIAAYAHDVDHAERWKSEDQEGEPELEERDFTDEERLRRHQERGAAIVGDFLTRNGAPDELVSNVGDLVSRHEFGGTREGDILKDADSLSFLETKVDGFLDATGEVYRKEDVREKFDWMYNRITSGEAKGIGRPWYEEAVEKLEAK